MNNNTRTEPTNKLRNEPTVDTDTNVVLLFSDDQAASKGSKNSK